MVAAHGEAQREWACPACTLINEPGSSRCATCEGLRPGLAGATSGVVVVLPPERTPPGAEPPSAAPPAVQRPAPEAVEESPASKRARVDADGAAAERLAAVLAQEEECWACPACTLVNRPQATHCLACEGLRWLDTGRAPSSGQAVRAAARRAARAARSAEDASSRTSTVQVWDSLPPVPDGHLPRESAADVELDMFGEPVCQEPEKPDEQASVVPPAAPAAEGPKGGTEEAAPRPSWGTGGSPLFAVAGASFDAQGPVADAAAMFEGSVARLATLGFDMTKCHLALEAASGDETMAREFLLREA